MNKIPRFMKEYATHIIECLRNCELMNDDIRNAKLEELKRSLKAYEKGLLTIQETMKIMSNI